MRDIKIQPTVNIGLVTKLRCAGKDNQCPFLYWTTESCYKCLIFEHIFPKDEYFPRRLAICKKSEINS